MYKYPSEVAELLRKGEKQNAMKKLMELKGVSTMFAMELIDEFNSNSIVEGSEVVCDENLSDISSFFKSKTKGSVWYKGCDMIDSVLDPQDAVKFIYRQKFDIPDNEEILYVRDTSFWSSNDQGLVITDKGIYCIPDNDNTSRNFSFPWHCVVQVKYKEYMMLFFPESGDPARIPLSLFMKGGDGYEQRIGDFLASLFTEISKTSIDPAEELWDQYNKIESEQGKDQAIEFAKLELQNNPIGHVLYLPILLYYFEAQEWRTLLNYCNEGLSNSQVSNGDKAFMHYFRGFSLEYNGSSIAARRAYFDAFISTDDDEMWGDRKFKEIVKEKFNDYEAFFNKDFLNLPYKDRKIIMPVESYAQLGNINHFIQVGIDSNIGITYPIGHPIEHHLYVGHPLVPNKYLAFETYQLEMIEDKVREFCLLAQCLGASKISINCTNNSSQNYSSKTGININGSAATVVDMSGQHNSEYSNQLLNELSRSINLNQTFKPTKQAFIPEGLIWYETEPSWQRLVNQRLNGGLLTHEERIESNKSQVIENRELSEIKAEIKTLFSSLNIAFDKQDENKFKEQENAILSINIEFVPLSELKEENNSTNYTNTEREELSPNEQEYFELFEEMIEDYGEIGEKERKRLERDRIRLSISETRVHEIEKRHEVVNFSEEEKEYLQEYKELLEDYGEIGDKERKRLEKIRSRLEISTERAKEIECISAHLT